MAKKAKKTAPKKAKPVAKAKPIKKAKPAKTKVSKAKPTRKAAPKKAAPKKAVVVKAPKKAEIKVVVVKEKGKRGRKPAIKPEALTDNKKTAPDNFQLNIFPVSNARPIAHKQTKGAPVNDDKTRYSDAELKFFEELIYKKLDKARDEFRILKGALNRADDEGTDSTSGGNTKVLEDGAETAEKENLSQLAARQLKYITNLENALVRIKNRTYGICTVTGKLISKERLIAVPHTTQSIEAKMMKKD